MKQNIDCSLKKLCKSLCLKHFNDPKTSIKYSNDMDDT